jgi:hypothetical protein
MELGKVVFLDKSSIANGTQMDGRIFSKLAYSPMGARPQLDLDGHLQVSCT